MPDIHNNYSLRELNTFHLDTRTKYFCECRSVKDLRELISDPVFLNEPRLILGEGSNILFSSDFDGLVIQPVILGREITGEDKHSVHIQVGAGENWDEFVEWATTWNFGGIENLSLIPGSVGSSPIQNIGAYGIEVEQTIERVFAIDILTGQKLTFEKDACRFGYRDSIFKGLWKNKCIITSVVFRLAKHPELKLGYQQLADKMAGMERQDVESMRQIIIEIRKSKLPDPKELGNAGSFFKNPVILADVFDSLSRSFPDIPSYLGPAGTRKIPAAWLIEQCGWKGKRVGNVGTYEKQPLVLVNHGNATGIQILELAKNIELDVGIKFGIRLEREVNIV